MVRRRGLWIAVVLVAAGLAGPPAAGAACVPAPVVNDRCEVWSAIYDHPGGHATTGIDFAFGAATSPDGHTVYVTGQSWDDTSNHYDVATLAYDAATGTQRWLSR